MRLLANPRRPLNGWSVDFSEAFVSRFDRCGGFEHRPDLIARGKEKKKKSVPQVARQCVRLNPLSFW